MNTRSLLFVTALFAAARLGAADTPWVSPQSRAGDFPLASAGKAAPVYIAPDDFKVVQIAANLFAQDVERVTGKKPEVLTDATKLSGAVVLAGTLGQSPLIDKLAADGKIDVAKVKGQWESFAIATVAKPLPGVDSALVIVGSDRRGTAYGIFELSQGIGVSPWYWWADVAPAHQDNLFVAAGTKKFGPPSVQYRGIFINDEDWGLHVWAGKTFEPENGGIGPKTYVKVFELLLRLKANTLWPAMHEVSKAFNAFPENKINADNYGIVMGASHCEPMLRNNVGEWPHDNQSAFNFLTNEAGVTKYWEDRVAENGKYENIYTIGMRGIHDSPMMGPRTPAQHVAALEKVFGVQRALLEKYVNPDASKVPQIFCPYKEVLGYYLNGLKIPGDVTLVFPDDNFGYIRYFPTPEQIAERPGGFGVYYHLSYLGSPFSYVWLNTTPPALIWEEMSKAYDHNIRKFWMLNVGDIKPGEVGTDLFMQMAWDINKWNLKTLPDFLTSWAAQQFGPAHAKEIAAVMGEYYRLGYQRKPEHLQWYLGREEYRPSDFTEAELKTRRADYEKLAATTEQLMQSLPAAQRDGFYELVGYPVAASALANERFIATDLSRKSTEAADWTAAFNTATTNLAAATQRYTAIGDGKWRNMMYDEPLMRTRSYRTALLPAPASTPPSAAAPSTPAESNVVAAPQPGKFAEKDGVISIHAQDFSRKTDKAGAAWQVIPGLGRTGDAVGIFPTTAPLVDLAKAGDAPALEYDFTVTRAGNVTINYNLIPVQPLRYGAGLQFAVAVDDGPAQLVEIKPGTGPESGTSRAWQVNVLNNSTAAATTHALAAPGPHKLKVYGLEPGVLLEKIVIDTGGLQPSYLGPPDTKVAQSP